MAEFALQLFPDLLLGKNDVVLHEGYGSTHVSVGNVFVKCWPQTPANKAVIDKQAAVIRHVCAHSRLRSAHRVECPRMLSVRGDLEKYAVAFDYFPGQQLHVALDGLSASAAMVNTIGDMMGRIGHALSTFRGDGLVEPSEVDAQRAINGFKTGQDGYWDLKFGPTHLPHADAVSDPSIRALVLRALAELSVLLESQLLSRGWVHGDCHPMNLILPAGASLSDQQAPSLGVVDWDDSACTLLASEPAIALSYLLMPLVHGSPVQGGTSREAEVEGAAAGMGAALLFAFCRHRPLTPADALAVLALVRARLAVSITSSARAAAIEKMNAGGQGQEGVSQVHAAPAAALLTWLYGGGEAREAGLCGAWKRAAAEGSALYSEKVTAYVPFSIADLDLQQLSASKAIIDWLQAQGREEGFHAVIACPSLPAGLVVGNQAALVTSAGRTCTSLAWNNKRDEAAWPSPPFVYDFTGVTTPSEPGQASLIEVVGAGEPAKLAAFVDMMFQPLMTTDADGSTQRLARLGWGQYGEARVIYTSEHFTGSQVGGDSPPEPRTTHLGVDLEAPAGTPVHAPFKGKVHSWAYNREDLDYGPCVVLQHEIPFPDGQALYFYTLYGHLSLSTLFTDAPDDWDTAGVAYVKALATGKDGAGDIAMRRQWTPRWHIGQQVHAGDVIGWLGGPTVNGGWPPHVHFQVHTQIEMGGWKGDYPGVCRATDWAAYQLLTPDPNIILRCPWMAPVGSWDP